MIRYALVRTSAGWGGLVEREGRVLGVVLPGRSSMDARARIARDWPEAEHERRILPKLQAAIRDYFSGKYVRFDADTDLSDLPIFSRKVLKACQQIPYGRTSTYGELARQVGKPGAARAVGQALGRNPIPLIIPCHRVLRSDGEVGGFSSPAGPRQKAEMLRLESRRAGGKR
jgi:methylated-DNA-[protein]-cysteine S-methyltransferase